MNPGNFQKLYLAELEELRSAESQMANGLDEMAKHATNGQLSQTIRKHRELTSEHRDRIDELLQSHGAAPRDHTDGSMKALLNEAEKWAGMVEDAELRDAALIASLQRMEHYEIAVLGTLATWAKRLGHENDNAVLSRILEDDRKADARFSKIAESTLNPAAA